MPSTNIPGREPEESDDLIELVDEEGKTEYFEHLATLEHQGGTFLVLSPAGSDPENEEEETEILIMQIQQDAKGQDIYIRPEEDLEEQVFERFLRMIDEMDDGRSEED